MNDAPIVIDDRSQDAMWRPQNDDKQFYGPTRLRMGLVRSRNLVSIRLLQEIGIPYVVTYLQKFGFEESQLPPIPSLALGSLNATPVQMATAYAVIANGGNRVQPYFIDKVTDSSGRTLLQASPKVVPNVLDKQTAYLITSALQDVIAHGTGRGALSLNRHDIAGKTGTTNDQYDAWFAGFNHDLVAISWMGFDQPQSIGEYAAETALPLWVDFMRGALAGRPNSVMPMPAGIVSLKIDPVTGLLANANQADAVTEYFRKDQLPMDQASANAEDGNAIASRNNEEVEHLW